MRTFDTLSAVLPLMKSYQTDLTLHDRAAIDGQPGVPFLHFTGECGTHLVWLGPVEDYPAKDEVVPYLFGTANREHCINQLVVIVKTVAKSHSLAVHHFDGKELHRISPCRAIALVEDYAGSIRWQWHRNETPHLAYS